MNMASPNSSPKKNARDEGNFVIQQTEVNGSVSDGGTTTQPDPTSEHKTPGSHKWGRKHTGTRDRIKDAFEGSWHYNGQLSYRRARQLRQDVERGQEYEYKNQYGTTSKVKSSGVETYLSSTRFEPRKLIVQASAHGILDDYCEWHRRRIEGSVPAALSISEWTLNPAFKKSRDNKGHVRWIGIPEFLLRSLIIALPLQVYMSFPIFTPPWQEDAAEDTYLDWPGYHWKWPKFAVNPLDMSPNSPDLNIRKLSGQHRLLRPRLLMVLEGDKWVKKNLDIDPNAWKPYVMVSYANRQFHTDDTVSKVGRRQLKRIAAMQAKAMGVGAYWMDFKCRADANGEQLDADVNRFCDVVRGANRVVIALPDESQEAALVWGKRMWTLPEGLLAPGNKVHVHYVDSDKVVKMTKPDLAAKMWAETDRNREGEDLQATRLLAEHFNGTLQLSRLQLMSTAMVALWDRKDAVQHTPAELAHALMGFLHTRIDPVPGNTLFQDIAKLSLLNDSDQLVERMTCLLPAEGLSSFDDEKDAYNNKDPFRVLSQPDEFNTHLWDIHPTCEVVGVDEQDRTIILNNCRAIPIRWKKFPKMLYKRTPSLKKLIAELFLRSGAWWFITALGLAWTYAPLWIGTDPDSRVRLWLGWTVVFFIGVGLLLSFLGPVSLRILYGGMVMEPAPHLVGFEGTMPITKLEKIIFGNDDGRISYEPSATPFSKDNRDPDERIGVEPKWVTDPKNNPRPDLKRGHRIFTLVDTGNMTVSIFQAQRPPTVALICGREGGMLRTVLCSWMASTNSLNKETVMRMPTDAFHMATAKGWLKLQLGREAAM